jgi:hypothetical protein
VQLHTGNRARVVGWIAAGVDGNGQDRDDREITEVLTTS